MNERLLNRYLTLATALYEYDSEIRTQHVAIVTYKNRIISVGRNSKKTTPANLLNRKIDIDGCDISSFRGTCAEYAATRKVLRMTNIPLHKCNLYSIRINNNLKPDYACPCSSCSSLIKFLDLKKVYYTTVDGNFKEYSV